MALTVKDVYEDMKKFVLEGKGDYVVFVTDDEEANGYHALYYGGQAITDYSKEDRVYLEEYNSDIALVSKNKDKAIYIG